MIFSNTNNNLLIFKIKMWICHDCLRTRSLYFELGFRFIYPSRYQHVNFIGVWMLEKCSNAAIASIFAIPLPSYSFGTFVDIRLANLGVPVPSSNWYVKLAIFVLSLGSNWMINWRFCSSWWVEYLVEEAVLQKWNKIFKSSITYHIWSNISSHNYMCTLAIEWLTYYCDCSA